MARRIHLAVGVLFLVGSATALRAAPVGIRVELTTLEETTQVSQDDGPEADAELHNRLCVLFQDNLRKAWRFEKAKSNPQLALSFIKDRDTNELFGVWKYDGALLPGGKVKICRQEVLSRYSQETSTVLLKFLADQLEVRLVDSWTDWFGYFCKNVPVLIPSEIEFHSPPPRRSIRLPFTEERFRSWWFVVKGNDVNDGEVTIRAEGQNTLYQERAEMPARLVLILHRWKWAAKPEEFVPDFSDQHPKLKVLKSIRVLLDNNPPSDPQFHNP